MIALVYPVSKVEWTHDVRKFADESLAVAGETDGVEGAMAFQDPSTGDTFTIILYRDQAAADAALANTDALAETNEKAKELGIDVAAMQPRVFTEVIAYL
jgi:hypothetical protein